MKVIETIAPLGQRPALVESQACNRDSLAFPAALFKTPYLDALNSFTAPQSRRAPLRVHLCGTLTDACHRKG